MPSLPEILFHETSARATDFLHELNDPSVLRNQLMPPSAAIELRRQQVSKLRNNIAVLTSKREEFNRKMDDYVASLEALIKGLEKSIVQDLEKSSGPAAGGASVPGLSTHVRCTKCETERVFREIQIIFARESDESFSLPTELYVLTGGSIKKGHFRCRACGTESLVIRAC